MNIFVEHIDELGYSIRFNVSSGGEVRELTCYDTYTGTLKPVTPEALQTALRIFDREFPLFSRSKS